VLEQQNHEKGKCKSVLYFALDHEPGEIELRVLWRLIVDQVKFCRDPKFNGIALRYAGWRKGLYRDLLRNYEDDARIYLKHLFALSETKFMYQRGGMNAKDIAGCISGNATSFNLYVVDHFHAISGLNRQEDQSEAITLITHAAELSERPVLVLGQFRKNSAVNNKCPLPAMEDFSGSSQLIYQPHNIVVMGPKASESANRYETYFHVVKSRCASDAKPFVGIHSFDIELKRYSDEYQVARYLPFGEPELIPNVHEVPAWAKRAKIFGNITAPRKRSWMEG
jgi:hypothetical protein